nr:hypothetical protein [uncultured Pseudomonas sp.]
MTLNDPLHHKPQVYAALNAMIEIRPALVTEKLRKNLNSVVVSAPDKDFASAAALIAWVKGALDALDAPAKERTKRYVMVGPATALLSQLEAFYFMPSLTSAVVDRVKKLTIDELAAGITTTLRYAAKGRSMTLLGMARSWSAVNNIFDKLILPLFGYLTSEDIKQIIRMPSETGADLISAHSYGVFIENVRKHASLNNEDLNELLARHQASYLVAT